MKQAMKRPSLLNIFVIVFSLSGAYFCSKLLYEDIYGKKSLIENQEEAGYLRDANTKVRRKLSDNLLWDPVDNSEKLYWNDSVQTDEKSQAIIVLKDGNEIKLGSSSLVSLEKDNDKLSLSLKSGELIVDTKGSKTKNPSQIKVNGVVLNNTSGNAVSLNIDEKKGVLTANTSAADGTAKQITVDKEGKVEEKSAPATLLAPAHLLRKLTTEKEVELTFEWSTKAAAVALEISEDKDFKKIFARKQTEKKSLALELKRGVYYWRVKDLANSLVSETRSLDLVYMEAPKTLGPEGDYKASYRSDYPAIEFSWRPSEKANKYILELSQDQNFKNAFLTEETKANLFKTSKLKDGKVYWKVSAVYENQKVTSDINSFEIVKLPETIPPALLAPQADFKVDYDFYADNRGIPFKWKYENKENYKFIIATSKDLKTEVASYETNQQETLYKEKLKEGTYYWAVGYKNPEGNWTYKEVRKLDVLPLIPVLHPPKLLTQQSEFDLDEAGQVKFQWGRVEGAKEYKFKLLRVTDDQDGKILIEERLSTLEKNSDSLEDGTYKYVLSTIDEFGRESKTVEKTIKVYRGPALEAPDFEMSEVQ